MYYIYQIINIKNGKRYVGRTKHKDKRKYRHFLELKNGTHHSIYLQRAYNKHGIENFKFEILYEFEHEDEVIQKEQELLDTCKNLYNVAKIAEFGGDLLTNHPNREEIIRKITKSTIKRYANMTPEERKYLSDSRKGNLNSNYGNKGTKNPLYKKPFTKEHRKNISKALTGRKLSEEHIRNSSNSRKGIEPWNKGLKTGPLSKEHKESLSKALKGRTQKERWVPVICEGVYFETLKHAANFYNVTVSTMYNRINYTSEKWDDFYYFDETKHNKNDYKHCNEKELILNLDSNYKGNQKCRKIYCEGVIYDSIREATKVYGFKSDSAILYRLKSDKWVDFYYI